MTLLEPDVFWSDIVLGFVALGCLYLLPVTAKRYKPVFVLLAIATWLGAFYHGLLNSTATLGGDTLWSATLLFFAAAALSIMAAVFGRKARPLLALLFVVYALWALLISEKFVWALLLQGLSLLCYGGLAVATYLRKRTVSNRQALVLFGLFFAIDIVAVVIQQRKLTFGLDISHNTIFHLLEMPSLVLLALSIRKRYAGQK